MSIFRQPGTVKISIRKIRPEGTFLQQEDRLVVEEPLEIRISHGPAGRRKQEPIAVTMRTPGDDFDLAAGFLFTEGIIGTFEDIVQIRFAGERFDPRSAENVVLVELAPGVEVDTDRLSRHFYTSSSCGVCGKASLDMVHTTSVFMLPPGRPEVSVRDLLRMPNLLREAQQLFASTGGIHAAALFNPTGQLELLREDVGRHNAMDKLIGAAIQKKLLPLSDFIVVVSGRAGFELVQKALMAGIPFMASVGAASSLAVELADEYGLTLVGFLREDQGNC